MCVENSLVKRDELYYAKSQRRQGTRGRIGNKDKDKEGMRDKDKSCVWICINEAKNWVSRK